MLQEALPSHFMSEALSRYQKWIDVFQKLRSRAFNYFPFPKFTAIRCRRQCCIFAFFETKTIIWGISSFSININVPSKPSSLKGVQLNYLQSLLVSQLLYSQQSWL